MTQNDNSFPTAGGQGSFGGTDATPSAGAREPSADFAVGTDQADTARPTGTTTTTSFGTGTTSGGSYQTSAQTDTYRPTQERTDYQPVERSYGVAERTRSRPSTVAVIGSAIAGAVAGGAIPFMLSGRKSNKSAVFLDERSQAQSTRSDYYEEGFGGSTNSSYRR